jgi:hypothetical protein
MLLKLIMTVSSERDHDLSTADLHLLSSKMECVKTSKSVPRNLRSAKFIWTTLQNVIPLYKKTHRNSATKNQSVDNA